MSTDTARLDKLAAAPSLDAATADANTLGSQLGHRIMALTVLAAALSGVAFAVVTAVQAFSDAWVAPLQLSPDMDAVATLRLNHARQESELARAEAEVQRIDADLAAVDGAITRLTGLRGAARQSVAWQSGSGEAEAGQLRTTLTRLDEQAVVLERLRERQAALLDRTRADLAAGLADRTELERQEQSQDSLAVSLLENARERESVAFRLAQLERETTSLRGGRVAERRGRNPLLLSTEEHTVRVEVELLRLESERRGLESMRRVAVENIARHRALLDDLRHRPVYRAMTARVDVAFIPYSQLDAVAAGAKVMDCALGLVNCRDVGTVTEVLPGEVVTQDPWGNPARGQYAVLELSDPTAIREKLLRLRRG